MKNKKIFITGGAGYLGKNLIKKWHADNEITIFSRDEAKHYFLKKEYPNVNFIVGDVRNYDLLRRSSRNYDIGVFAASLKQIEACEKNYEEANQIIVQGTFNSKIAAIENNFESACYISSDKSICPTTIYGMCKALAGESFISSNEGVETKLSTAIYGNIANSTGSIIPLIWDCLKRGRVIPCFGGEMTRFLLTIESAITLIENGLECRDVNVIPQAKSFKIKDLLDIYTQEFGLKYVVSQPRENEKIHELMASSEHMPRMRYVAKGDYYIMCKNINGQKLDFPNNEYSSKDFCLSVDDLYKFLKDHNFYKPE
jgi:UDP-glucose 4-epimerase